MHDTIENYQSKILLNTYLTFYRYLSKKTNVMPFSNYNYINNIINSYKNNDYRIEMTHE